MLDPCTKVMMIDTETTNSIDCPIAYDVGYSIFNLQGDVFEKASLANREILADPFFMTRAFYAAKANEYWREIDNGQRELLTWKQIRWRLYGACKRYDVKIISAHNAAFDYRSLHKTQRYITTSQYRYVLPYDCEWWDTLKMARQVFKADPLYKPWCFEHGFITKRNQAQMTAEVIYRYITNNLDFIEKHTGLADVEIERDIFLYCYQLMPEIDGRLWPPKEGETK